METPLQIRFLGMDPSDAVEDLIREKAAKLERFHPRIIGCQVTLDLPHQRHRKGNEYQIQVAVDISQDKLVVNRSVVHDDMYLGVYAGIRNAFDTIERMLKQQVNRKSRKNMGHPHASPPTATVIHINRAEGFGFLKTDDDREIYFHENSVVNKDFSDLEVGQKVQFHEEDGFEGPQASSVLAS